MPGHADLVENARLRWNAGDLAGYLELYDEDIRLHGYTPEPMGKQAVRGFYEMIWSTLGAPGRTSPQLDFHEVTIMRFRAGRVVERWSTADFLGLLVQLGAVPAATS